MLTTIQISANEDRLITQLKNLLGLRSKKAVVMAGIRELVRQHQAKKKQARLKKAVLTLRSSPESEADISHLSSALEHWDDD